MKEEINKNVVRKPRSFKVIKIFLGFLILIFLINFLFGRYMQVSGNGMTPNYLPGQFYLTNESISSLSEIKKEDVIIFNSHQTKNEDFLSRVIALPGEAIVIRGGQVLVNGLVLKEPYLAFNTMTRAGSFMLEGEEKILPENNYFVMGDNRTNSNDSRMFGFIIRSDIVSKLVFCYRYCNSVQDSPVPSEKIQTPVQPSPVETATNSASESE